MKHFVLPFFLAAQLLAALAQSNAHAQSIDPHEIVRRGNRVEVVNAADTHAQTNADADFLAAFAPPADDSHKWFITVVTLDGCGPCKQLLADWQASPALAAFALPGNARASWAHLNVYAAEDETQTWRWKNITLKSYPTILLQPPRNGRYGNAATVVLQKSGYNGKPEELAKQLRAAIEKHARKTRSDSAKQRSSEILPAAANAATGLGWRVGRLLEDQRDALDQQLCSYSSTSFEQKSPPFAPPAKPALPTPLPSVDPLPLLPAIPPSIDPDAKPAPLLVTPKPSEPTPAEPKPADEKYPQHPEAVVIVDKLAESYSDAQVLAQIQRVLARLRAERPGILVKLLDVRDARQYPVEPRELPAVLTTNEGRLETKLDRTLLPIVAAEPPPFPWTAVVGLLANGFNWAGVAALGIWAVAMIRARRKAAGQKLVLSDELVQQVRTLVEELLKGKTTA